MARHAQITQDNKLAISLQYRTKEVSDEVDILHAEEHEGFLHFIYFLFNVGNKNILKVYSKNSFSIKRKC